MTVQWTVRAANDRARRRESSPVSRTKKREAVTITASFFCIPQALPGLEVGAVVNDSPVDCQSRE